MISSKITVLLRNNSVQFVHEEPPSGNLTCGLLLLVMAAGVCLNASVLFSIAFAPLRATTFNRLLACLSAAATLEDVANVTSAVVFRSSWEDLHRDHGEKAASLFCLCNAAAQQVVAIFQGCVLAAMTYERSLSLKGGEGEVKSETSIPLAVFLSLATTIPVGFFSTRHVEQRYGCSAVYVTHPTQILAASFTILLGYCLPSSLMLTSCLTIIKEILKERRRIQVLELVARQRASAGLEETAAREMSLYVLPGVLVFFYLLLVLPNAVSVQTTQFYASYHVKREPTLLFEEFVANKTELPERLRPVVTNAFDSVCVWARYGFTIVSPCVIVFFHEGLRKQCGNWRKSLEDGGESRRRRRRRALGEERADPRTPVLFATSEGLHLRTQLPRSKRFAVSFCDLSQEEDPGRKGELARDWHSLDDHNSNGSRALNARTWAGPRHLCC